MKHHSPARRGLFGLHALAAGLVLSAGLFGPVTAPALAAAGDVDTTFGSEGFVTVDFFGKDKGQALAVYPDGKLVVVGTAKKDIAVVRLLPDGDPDPSFGKAGKVITNLGAAGRDTIDEAYGVTVQPADGKVIVVGRSNAGGKYDFAVLRFTTDGKLDPTFGGDGVVLTNLLGNEQANAVAVQSDGKIVVGGTSNGKFAVARYNADGTLDSGFGEAGRATTNFSSKDEIKAILIESESPDPGERKIVAVGHAITGGLGRYALARYNDDGSPDQSFNLDGKASYGFQVDARATAAARQADGMILAAGNAGVNSGVVRLDDFGSRDDNFGTEGRVVVDFGGLDTADGVLVDSQGRIILAGTAGTVAASSPRGTDVYVARFLPEDGEKDKDFGKKGSVKVDFGFSESVKDAQFQGSKIVVAGSADGSGKRKSFLVARFLNS